MKIYCPHCGVKGSADDSYSGRTIKCPKCQEMFALTTDMAIDPSEFLTVDLDSPVAALAESEEQVDVLDSSESAKDDVEPEELAAEEEGSIDWGDFGAALDKEIADSEAEDVTGDLLEKDSLLEEDSPIAAQGDLDKNLSLDGTDTAEDKGLAGDLGHMPRVGREDAEDVLEEVVEEHTDIDEEITESLAAEEDEIIETVDTVDAIEDTVEDESDVMDVIIGDDSDDVVIEDAPHGLDKDQCWQCGKEDSVGKPFIAVDGRLYCTDCLPAEEVEEDGMSAAYVAAAGVTVPQLLKVVLQVMKMKMKMLLLLLKK